MKLRLLHEMATTTASLAMPPIAMDDTPPLATGGMRLKKRKGRGGIVLKNDIDTTQTIVEKESYGKESNQPCKQVWQGINKKWRGKKGNITAGPDPWGPGRDPSWGKPGSYP